MKPKVAIVYLSYNGKRYLDEVIEALRAQDYPRERLELIVVDNASTDGSGEYLRAVEGITFIQNGQNGGFAEGNNIGIHHALLHGAEYLFLHNNDLKLAPDAITRAVELAESDARIGSVQSLMLLWKKPEIVNSTGGMVHFLGFGFVRDNGEVSEEAVERRRDGEEIAYASGAAVLYRASALQHVGLLDPFLFMYHEDLELGWRLRLAGYKNVLSMRSRAYHDYEFKRSREKFFFMERNRWLVHFSHLRWRTLLLLWPWMVLLEPPLLAFAARGGWFKQKLRVYAALFSPPTWVYIARKRRESRAIRRVDDRTIISLFTSRIAHQETDNLIVRGIANPLLTAIWGLLKVLIRW
ncbi:glycosyltransferase family 2 protein [Candidatus Parcubacteria bacterium]|nr:glycosyltransferase family 2 protein [Candidatus Parcubacteria bacterium]